MKKLIFALVLWTVSASATPSNKELIAKEILGHVFCYTNNSDFGWIFTKEGTAVAHGISLGMPGPGSFYKVTFIDSPRTLGLFTLVNQNQSLQFQYNVDQVLYEYRTGLNLSVKACGHKFKQ